MYQKCHNLEIQLTLSLVTMPTTIYNNRSIFEIKHSNFSSSDLHLFDQKEILVFTLGVDVKCAGNAYFAGNTRTIYPQISFLSASISLLNSSIGLF